MALTEPLDAVEERILGVLVEKEFTTPEGYPLSMNALVSGCNQKSNRDPTVSYTEQTVHEALLRLRMHRIVRELHTSGARVVKFAHAAREVLEVDEPELGVLAELLLRGAQTHGELRGRVKRMAPVDSLAALAMILSKLETRGMVRSLPPSPGSRAGRVNHLLGVGGAGDDSRQPRAASAGERPAAAGPAPTATVHVAPTPLPDSSGSDPADTTSGMPEDGLAARVAALEAEVARLTRRLDSLAKSAADPEA